MLKSAPKRFSQSTTETAYQFIRVVPGSVTVCRRAATAHAHAPTPAQAQRRRRHTHTHARRLAHTHRRNEASAILHARKGASRYLPQRGLTGARASLRHVLRSRSQSQVVAGTKWTMSIVLGESTVRVPILLAPSLSFIWKTLVFIERCVGEWCRT